MADKAFNIAAIVADMQTIVDGMRSSEGSHFEKKVLASRKLGVAFGLILAHDRKVDEKMTPTTCYGKHDKVLGKVIGKTIMLNECYPLSTISEADVRSALAAYREVGRKDKGKDAKRWFNADGSPKLRIDIFAACAVADDKKWNRKTGAYVSSSGNATTSDKAKAAKVAKRNDEVVAALNLVSPSIVDTEWDLRYFTEAELTAMKTAILAEVARREVGGKALVAS